MTRITPSLEDYLETIYLQIGEKGSACVRDVAKALVVKMPSVVKAIRELKARNLATQKPYSAIVGRAAADADACRMEHILSPETLERIRDFTEKGRDEAAK